VVVFDQLPGVRVLAIVCAALAAAVAARHDCGDHTIFVGRVIALRDDERPPLVFHGGKYATLHYKTTKAPEAAIDFWELDHDANW
jgi:flavin reductase (DIM6/NTAB) family NADH-FMN oxidoreductase RutF